jgi:Methylase involved in ubiquinone/menaquinone biosynthesis
MIPLTCPICNTPLTAVNGTLICASEPKPHTYDIAASGYVNLLNPGKKNNAKAGDSKEMVRARADFLRTDAYSRPSDALTEIVRQRANSKQTLTLADAGCGEGYYTLNIAKSIENSYTVGFDASKHAAEAAAKCAKRMNLANRAMFFAANIFSMPIADASCDVVTNLFAPEADAEFLRVLKTDGSLIVGSAGEYHLAELKDALYGENAHLNELRGAREIHGLTFENKVNVRYKTTVATNEMIKNLFTMTPYRHRTSAADSAKLDSLQSLEITVDFDFYIYRKI